MSRAQSQPPLLRVAAVWGTTVLAIRHLAPGQVLRIGDAPDALVARPEGSLVPEQPFSAVGNGWEVDPRGVTGGTLRLRGRDEAPDALAKTGAPVLVVAGDYGLLQYGQFALFFQFTAPVRIASGRPRFDWGLVSSFAFSLCMIGGTMLALRSLTPQKSIDKPLELTSLAELAERLHLTPPVEVPESGGGSQKKSEEPSGGGKKMAQAEGALGKRGPATVTKISGARPGLGGVAEALSGSVGQEVRETLGSISSVAAALGGLNSDSLVMGSGSGTGLRGGGPGGGGDGPGGVPYGAGALDTGGMGAGTGTGPGGRGLGNGSGTGNGSGNGSGDGAGGERKLAGKDAAPAGQGLSPGAISRVVMSRSGAFRACYESVAAGNPGLSGTVSVRFGISPSGDVQTASIAGSSLSNPRVEGCVLRQIKRLHFPSADKGSSATFPFVFKPSKR